MNKYRSIAGIIFLIIFICFKIYDNYIYNEENVISDKKNTLYNNNLEEKNYTIEQMHFFDTSYEKHGSDWIYVGSDNDNTVLSKVSITGDTKKIEDNILRSYSWGIVVGEYKLARFKFENFNVQYKTINIPNISYDDLVNDISAINCTYKLFNGTSEVTSGQITNKMTLKVFYDDTEVDSYNINVYEEYVNLDKLNIKNEEYVIKNISTVGELKQEISTNGKIIVSDKEGNLLNDNQYLTTNSKIKIQLFNKNYEYVIVVVGDVTGSGDIFIGDVSKLYNYYKKTIDMEECYVIAGDVTYDGAIEINDIAKLYQYYQKIINKL